LPYTAAEAPAKPRVVETACYAGFTALFAELAVDLAGDHGRRVRTDQLPGLDGFVFLLWFHGDVRVGCPA
jgi:hypothetical protein